MLLLLLLVSAQRLRRARCAGWAVVVQQQEGEVDAARLVAELRVQLREERLAVVRGLARGEAEAAAEEHVVEHARLAQAQAALRGLGLG